MSERTLHQTGLHDAKIIDHGVSSTKSGSPCVEILFNTEHGYIRGWLYFTDRAAEYSIEKLKNAGFNGNSLEQLNDGQCLVGNRCVISIDHEEYNGKTSAKVKGIHPEGYEGADVQRDAAAAQNIKRFDALLRKAQNGNGGVTTPADAPGEECPF